MSLTGKQIANSYKDLLQMQNNNAGVPIGTLTTVRDGDGNATPLQLSQGTVNINGTFQYQGVTLTTNVSGLNAAATGSSLVTGIVAEDGNTKFGRTLTASTGVTITNATGESGNPTFALADTSVSAGEYGPMNTITVDAQGRITDVTATTTISANAFIGGTLSGSSLYVENNVSVSGTLNVAGTTNLNGKLSVSNDINSTGTLTVAGATSVTGKLTAGNISTSVVSATYLYGDGSNITGVGGGGTVTRVDAGTGIHFTENGTTTTNFTGSGTIAVDTNQTFGVVSATSFIIGGDNVAMSATLAALSATMATSIDNSNTNITTNTNAITSINTVVAGVSALTSVNAAAITSINTVVENLSATMATSINNRTTAITSINTVITNLSATLATSIANYLPLAGGTMTGSLILSGAPTATQEAATKQYVDNLASSAIHFHEAVRVESISNLNATYNNGTAGVGATLTNAGSQAALVIDGITMVVADRVLVDNQTDKTQNGVYTVTNIGSPSTNWVLTRATDADSYSPGDNTGLDEGSYFLVTEGNTSEGNAYICSNVGTITFGTTDITFAQFSSSLVYSGGTGINVNDSRVISVSGVPSSAAVAALSATMATSINNSNTNITTNTNAITSINNVTTSINTVITNLSATMATSIGNHLPLAGGTLTGTLNGVNAGFTGEVSASNLVGANVSVTGRVVATSVSAGHIHGDIFQGETSHVSITGTSQTPPMATATHFIYTLKNSITINNPSGEPQGASGVFVLIQDGTGSRTVSWGSEYRLPGGTAITLSTDASAVDVVPYFVQVTGTILIGNPTLNVKVSA